MVRKTDSLAKFWLLASCFWTRHWPIWHTIARMRWQTAKACMACQSLSFLHSPMKRMWLSKSQIQFQSRILCSFWLLRSPRTSWVFLNLPQQCQQESRFTGDAQKCIIKIVSGDSQRSWGIFRQFWTILGRVRKTKLPRQEAHKLTWWDTSLLNFWKKYKRVCRQSPRWQRSLNE